MDGARVCKQAACEGAGRAPELEEIVWLPARFSASPLPKFLPIAMAVSLFHPFSKSCLTSLKSMSSVLKTTKQNSTHIHAHYTHTLGSTKGNGIPSPSPVCTIYWFCDPCRITSILRSFLICETETTMCLDCRIIRIK